MERAVLVTTEHRGVFFGFADDAELELRPKATLRLKRCRNCVWWDKSVGGFLGLASQGPSAQCRIGSEAEQCDVYDITSVTHVSEAAVQAWTTAKVL